MDQRRWLLFIVLTVVVYVIFYITYLVPYQRKIEEYRKAHPEKFRKPEAVTTPTATAATTGPALTVGPETTPTSPTAVAETKPPAPPEGEETEITVWTDLYHVVLTTRGGRPTSWQYFDRVAGWSDVRAIEMIPQRPALPERELPLEVVFKESNRLAYPEFNTAVYDFRIEGDGATTEVTFISPTVKKLQVVKTYLFRRNDYLTSLRVVLRNLGDKASCQINDDERGLGISWGPGVRNFSRGETADLRFVSAVYGTPKWVGHAAPRKPDDEKQYRGEVLWAGATDKFFLAAVIPRTAKGTAIDCLVRLKNLYPEKKSKRPEALRSPPFTIVLYGERFDLRPRRQVAFDYQIFVGPKRPTLLRDVSRRTGGCQLERVLFYRSMFQWMRWLKLGLMYSLNFLHSLVGNYGLAIVILTILIRIVTHPLAHKGMKLQAKTMAEMQKIKPLLDEVNRKYKNDPAKRNQEMMRLYKEHGISPLAPLRGCLPMLIQIPIFFALYSLLIQYIDLRGASFLWIDDLSGPDKLVDLTRYGLDFRVPIFGWHVGAINALPILMGVSQYLMSKLTPTPSRDQSQKQMMLMFSLIFPILLYNFPSGLFIYWLINNVWQSIHQLIANRLVRKPPEGQAVTAKA